MKFDIEQIEQKRIEWQATLDAAKDAAARNKMGQFATPTTLARDILAYGCQLLGLRKRIRFFDPAIGTGSFYSALRAVAPETRISRCTGYEIDPHYASPALDLWKNASLELRVGDFTTAEPPSSAKDKANLIICNPPYVRHHHMPAARKRALQAVISERLGLRPNGLSGLYCYFLWLADAWLAPGGVAGWLIPSEWMDVNYGAAVKQYLLSQVKLLRVHRFEPTDVQFDDALVSSAIVWFQKAKPTDADDVEFSIGGTLAAPRKVTRVGRSTLHTTRKWTQLPATKQRRSKDQGPTLSDVLSVKRGIATGSNRFFVLSLPEVDEYRIPWRFLRPILPGPRHLPVDEITARDDGTPDLDKRLFLLSAEQPEDSLRKEYPGLWKYLQQGMELGIHERYLCRHRRPWYSQEHRPPAPLLCTYMGRQGGTGRPFRFILNRSNATAANVYLLLYPRPQLRRAMEQDENLLPRIWAALNELPIEILIGEGRVYGGGLHKLEPKELANTSLDALGIRLPDATIERKHQNLELFSF